MGKNNQNKINFTSIVVTYNEESHLDECLSALDFCQEKIVIDLGSSDNCVKISEKHKCTVIKHERVEIVEQIREWAVEQSSNDWIIFIDPDEIFPKEYLAEIEDIINANNVGGIRFKRINYFIGYPVKHGLWYGKTYFTRLFNKNAVYFNNLVHDGMRNSDQFEFIKYDRIIKHYWIDDIAQFYEKHNRYLKYEGESRYKRGLRFSIVNMYLSLIKNFILWFIFQHGFCDMKNGWTLIKLAMWYELKSWLSLRDYQNSIK